MKLNGDIHHFTDFPELWLANEPNRRPGNYAKRLQNFLILSLAHVQRDNDLWP